MSCTCCLSSTTLAPLQQSSQCQQRAATENQFSQLELSVCEIKQAEVQVYSRREFNLLFAVVAAMCKANIETVFDV